MFLYCCSTGSTTTLTVLALTDNVHSVLNGSIYKICQFLNFGETSFVCQSIISEYFNINIMYPNRKNTIAYPVVIYGLVFDGKCKSNQENNNFKNCKTVDGICIECIEEYYLGEDNKCSKSKNCAEINNGICIQCIDNYHLGLDNLCSEFERPELCSGSANSL